MTLPLHGSNPIQLYQALQIEAPNHYIDFSVNLNPFGTLSEIAKQWDGLYEKISDYPSTGENVLSIIAENERLKANQVMIGNGGAELIALLANYFRKRRIGIVQPTFVEYERMCRAFECSIKQIVLMDNHWGDLSPIYEALPEIEALFLCHPNNPSGVIYTEEQLIELIEQCEMHDCHLIVDEAFYDFAIKMTSLASYVADNRKLIILRSLTKMYNIAGLRFGYLLAPKEIIEQLKAIQPHWSVNALALEVSRLCLTNENYAIKTRRFIHDERNKLLATIRSCEYETSNSKVNYFLLKDKQLNSQRPLLRFLLEKGIVPRHTENFVGLDGRWLRFAIKTTEENLQLVNVLKEWKNSNT